VSGMQDTMAEHELSCPWVCRCEHDSELLMFPTMSRQTVVSKHMTSSTDSAVDAPSARSGTQTMICMHISLYPSIICIVVHRRYAT
jgi:hypothetical protein